MSETMDPPLNERDDDIVRMRADGMSLEQIGLLFDLSRQRVWQIVDESGGPSASEVATARRAAKREERDAAVGVFIATYSPAIKRLAAAGVPRSQLEKSIELLCPHLPPSVVSAGIDQIDVLFNVASIDTHYSAAVLEAAVWYAIGVEHEITGEVAEALPFVDASVASELQELLVALGLSQERVSEVLTTIALAKRRVDTDGELALSKKSYDTCRSVFLKTEGLESSKGTTVWPPTSQTVLKRFGRGYWSTAMESLGLNPMSGGRERGLLVFTSDEYVQAVTDYLRQAAANHARATFAGYNEWTVAEDRAGRRRPSGASVRLRFDNWTNAKREAQTAQTLHPSATIGARPGTSLVARSALLAAEATLATTIQRLQAIGRAEASSQARDFLRRFFEEFEIRRRDWIVAVVRADPAAFAARLAGPPGKLTRAQRAVTPLIENLDRVLTDRYLDSLLGDGDPTETDGWFRPDLQAELDLVPKAERLRFAAGRAMRNLFTHHSDESQRRVTNALSDLSAVDNRFELRQQPTPVVLADWLVSTDFRRLRALIEVIPGLWRVAVVVETLAEPDAQPPHA